MSRFANRETAELSPYVPGEQPQDKKYIKLNTNEAPFPPSEKTKEAVVAEVAKLNLYSDPTSKRLVSALAKTYGVDEQNIFVGNGSDEVLGFVFKAFFGKKGVAFADLTYGFYPVYAQLFGVRARIIPVREDLSIATADYSDIAEDIVIANPNAQTGLCIAAKDIIDLVVKDKKRLVVVDEAYIDFGGESVIKFTKDYDNLLVVGTMSKSKSFAGGRIGYAIGNAGLIEDINKIKYSFNSYNVNRLSEAAAVAVLEDAEYYNDMCAFVVKEREYLSQELRALGFSVTDSKANFLLVESPLIAGKTMYEELKKRGVLVRYLGYKRIPNSIRITIGTQEETQFLLCAVRKILEEIV